MTIQSEELNNCPSCKGTGSIKHSSNPHQIGSVTCPYCNGSGEEIEEFTTAIKENNCGDARQLARRLVVAGYSKGFAPSVDKLKSLCKEFYTSQEIGISPGGAVSSKHDVRKIEFIVRELEDVISKFGRPAPELPSEENLAKGLCPILFNIDWEDTVGSTKSSCLRHAQSLRKFLEERMI